MAGVTLSSGLPREKPGWRISAIYQMSVLQLHWLDSPRKKLDGSRLVFPCCLRSRAPRAVNFAHQEQHKVMVYHIRGIKASWDGGHEGVGVHLGLFWVAKAKVSRGAASGGR